MDWIHALAGFLVGALVGATGVGGGSLMAPILVLLLGVKVTTAVGTDLWFAAITKMVGSGIHQSLGEPDWEVVKRLAWGSIPASIITSLILSQIDMEPFKSGLIITTLGVLLIITAVATLSWGRIRSAALSVKPAVRIAYKTRQAGFTTLAGVILGVLVTLTSIGAGALGAAMLLALYPLRMSAKRLVGTDIVHAVPLTIVAGTGHLLMGNVDVGLLGSLLVGSIPGIIVGSLLATKLDSAFIRPVLALVLLASGVKMLIS